MIGLADMLLPVVYVFYADAFGDLNTSDYVF